MSTGLLPRRSTSAGAECKSSAPPCTREDAGSGECAPAGRCFVAVALLPPSAPIARIARRPSLRAERLAVGERATLRRLRSEEHTSELQSRGHLVCRLLLEKKKQKPSYDHDCIISI